MSLTRFVHNFMYWAMNDSRLSNNYCCCESCQGQSLWESALKTYSERRARCIV